MNFLLPDQDSSDKMDRYFNVLLILQADYRVYINYKLKILFWEAAKDLMT